MESMEIQAPRSNVGRINAMRNKKIFIEIQAQEELLNNIFKYYVGSEHKKSNADKIKSKMLDFGFDGAFVVAFYKDTRISIQEALALQAKIQNNE